MAVKLSKINIKAFRGIPELELDLDGKSLIIKGENGSGKSSIVDAIELFFTGKVLHLDGIQGLSLYNHGTHVNYKQEDVKISLTFNPGNIAMIRTFDSSFSIPEGLESFFKITNNGTFILRRSQLLVFISSRPADRFRAIGSIIGIEALDELELEMKRLRDELDGNVKSKSGQINSLYREISVILGKDITDQSDILKPLNELLKDADLPLIESLDEAKVHAERMLKSIKKADQLDRIKTLNQLLELTKEPFAPESLFADLSSLNDKIKPLLNRSADLLFKSLLELGSKIILERNLNACPLCENVIEPERLLKKIQERVDLLSRLSDDASTIRLISVPLISTLNEINLRIELLESKAAYFEQLKDEIIILQGKKLIFQGLIDGTRSAIDLLCEIPIEKISDAIDVINVSIEETHSKGKELLDNIDLTAEERRVLEIASVIDQIRNKYTEISKKTDELKSNQVYYFASKKIYDNFSDVKKVKIQEVYDIIEEDIRRFYSFLHPGEPHKNIELTVATGKRASTELKIESFGRKGEDPRALTSEGHLDSLGLCIFG
jgi:DNA repair exonuclease SbcCD ATPase subunit